MVQKGTQKSKNKAPSQNPSSKKGTKQPTEAADVNNDCGDSEESQSNNINTSDTKAEAGTSKSHTEKIEMKVDQTSNVKVNGENSIETETTSNAAKQPVKTRGKKTMVASTEEISAIKKGSEKSSRPPNKIKGKQQKENQSRMETEEQMAVEEEPTTETSTSMKRKMAESSEPADVKQPKINDDHTTSKEDKAGKGHKSKEVVGDEAVPKNVAEPIPQTSKSRNKKSAKSAKAENNKAKSIQEKRGAASVSNVKAKRLKVSLKIPSFKTTSGKVFVIGENDVGQLGFGEEVDVKKRPAMLELPYSITDIQAGGMHSVCLTESGEVITFGCNDEGALGRITLDDAAESTPHRVEGIKERVIQISAGDSHSAALTELGKVYLWGNFRSGDGPMGLTADGAKQVNPIRILNNVTIVKISSGTEHLACLSNEGFVYTCGCGENGQLGRLAERACRDGGRKGPSALLEPALVPMNNRGKTIRIEDLWCGSYTTFLKAQETGSIYAFGLNNYNHLGYENERVRFSPKQISSFNNRTWLHISGGQHHTLALDSENVVYALGRKEYGRLGLGEDCDEKSIPTVIPTLENDNCNNISCGNCVSFALTEDGSVYSWGMGTNHQLGHGNDDDCHVPHRIEGNFSNSWKAFKVSGGGQHTLILASPKESAKSDKK